MKPLRIHVVALGYLSDRVYLPIIKNKADLVYILKLQNETNKKALEALKRIKEELKKKRIPLKEVFCEIFNIPSVVKVAKEIIQKEHKNHIYFNISSGNTISSNAFTLASMLYRNLAHHIKIYYIPYDYSKMQAEETNINLPPSFRIHTPNEKQCVVLKLLDNSQDGLRKSQILDSLHSTYKSSRDRKLKSNLLMSLNRQIIDKLIIDWGMIEVKGRGKGTIVRLTNSGKEFVKFI